MLHDLARDFATLLRELPPGHSHRRTLLLLQESLRRDADFVTDHPTALFQSLWNSAWWYDCAEADRQYDTPQPEKPPELELSRLPESFDFVPKARKREPKPPGWKASHRGVSWDGDRRACHEAICPLCGRGEPVGSGNYEVELRFGFLGDTPEHSFDGRFDFVRFGCECMTGTGRKQIYFFPYQTEYWIRERILSYLEYIGSPLVDHPSWKSVPAASEWKRKCEDSGLPAKSENAAPNAAPHVSLSALLELWKDELDEARVQRPWLRSTRAPLVPLGVGQLAEWRSEADFEKGLLFAPDGKSLVTRGSDENVKIWDCATGLEIAELPIVAESIAFSATGDLLACGDGEGVLIWQRRGELHFTEIEPIPTSDQVTSLAFSPDEQHLAVGDQSGRVTLYRLDDREERFSGQPHRNKVLHVSFTADGSIVSGGDDNTIFHWEAATGNCTPMVRVGQINSISAVNGGRRAVVGGQDNCWSVIDVMSNELQFTYLRNIGAVNAVAVSSDERRVVTGSTDRTVRVWEAATGKQLACYQDYSSHLASVAISPDGRLIGSVNDEGVIRLYAADAAPAERRLRGNDGLETLSAAAFTPDGRYVVTGGTRTVRVWDAHNGIEQSCHRFDNDPLGCSSQTMNVAVALDSQRFAAVHLDSKLRVYALNGQLLEQRGLPQEGFFDNRPQAVFRDDKIKARPKAEVDTEAPKSVGLPWALVPDGRGMKLEFAASRTPVAWFPGKWEQTLAHPAGRTFAGIDQGTFHLARLENEPDPPASACAFCGQACSTPLYFPPPFARFVGQECLLHSLESSPAKWAICEEPCVLCGSSSRHGVRSPAGTLCVECGSNTLRRLAAVPNLQTISADDIVSVLTTTDHRFFPRFTVLSRVGELRRLIHASERKDEVYAAIVAHLDFLSEHPLGTVVREGALAACKLLGKGVVPFLLRNDGAESWRLEANSLVAAAYLDLNRPEVRAFVEAAARRSRADVHLRVIAGTFEQFTHWLTDVYEHLIRTGSVAVRSHLARVLQNRKEMWAGVLSAQLARDPEASVRQLAAREERNSGDRESLRGVVSPPHTGCLLEIPGRCGVSSRNGSRILGLVNDPEGGAVWDAVSGDVLTFLAPADDEESRHFYCCGLSPDGGIAVAGFYGKLATWDIASGNCLGIFGKHDGGLNECGFSPDGRLILAAGCGDLGVWDARNGMCVGFADGLRFQVYSARFSPDGLHIASASQEGFLRIWTNDLSSKLLETRRGSDDLSCVDWIPQTQMVVTGTEQLLVVWDIVAGREVFTLDCEDRVTACACSPDAQWIAAGCYNGAVVLWGVASRRIERRFQADDAEIKSLAFSPQGDTLLTSTWGSTRIWRLAEIEVVPT